MVVYVVKEGDETKSLWFKPGGSLHIGINDFLPLKGKNINITKSIIDDDVLKGTRYTAIEVKQEELIDVPGISPKGSGEPLPRGKKK
jgi:hypothetical protein